MTVLELLAEKGPLRPAEIAAQLGKRSASIRAYLARLVREGQVERLADGRYAVAVGAADSRPEDAGTKPASPVPAAFAPPRSFSPAKAPHIAWQRPAYWAAETWRKAFDAVLGELAEEVDQRVRQGLFTEAMLFRLKLPAENCILTPEQALILQSHALKQATEVRLRLRPPRRRSKLAWLLGDDADAEPEPARDEDELQTRFRRIRQQMHLCAARILEQALR